MLNEQLVNKWQPVLDHEDMPEIKESYRKVVTAHMLEQQETAMREEAHNVGSASLLGESTVPTTIAGDGGITSGNVQNFDPVLISLVRRTAPNLIAFDIMGVQPMSGPTGLIFALRPTYANDNDGNDLSTSNAFYDEANSAFSSGQGPDVPGSSLSAPASGSEVFIANTFLSSDAKPAAEAATLSGVTGAGTADAEAWGTGSVEIPSMSFQIDKSSVTAKTRALKAEYTVELAQDLKAIHGLDAETELANILTTEINAEINREIVRSIYFGAKEATVVDAGSYSNGIAKNLDGRWLVERFKSLVYKIETEANIVAKETRRGKGNFIICSSDVASALNVAGVLDPSAALTVDDTGSTFAGTVGAGMKVYIDPYTVATDDFVVVGYKGTSPYDAGMFYCPYVPLQMVRAIGEDNFQPKIGFKTRYGMGVNPFAQGNTKTQAILANSNRYYRGFVIQNLAGGQ
jgi:hypothetical protein